MKRALLAVMLLTAASPALAQRNGNYQVTQMNFDPMVPGAGRAAGGALRQAHAAGHSHLRSLSRQVEATKFLIAKKEQRARLDRDILRNDPIDNPVTKDLPAQRPDLNTPSTSVPPRP
jgi:hypothetical protein